MTDQEIMDGLFRREETALLAAQQKYRRYCASIAGKIVADLEAAEEVCSDVWLRLWQSIPPARPDDLRLYIGRTARNRALHHLEREHAAKRSGIRVQLEELGDCLPDRSAELEPDRLALRQVMADFVRGLSREKQLIFLRRYWYGDTVDEIADRIGCKSSRVTGILYRLRKELRKKLEQEEIEL